jgi:hypothetical protein
MIELYITKQNKSILDPTPLLNYTMNNNPAKNNLPAAPSNIYMIDEIIKLKCVDDFDLSNKSYDNITIGNTYTGNITNSKHYYFIHETQTVLPSELFIPLHKWREITINEIIKQ